MHCTSHTPYPLLDKKPWNKFLGTLGTVARKSDQIGSCTVVGSWDPIWILYLMDGGWWISY